jgi:hypothetical protein
MSEGEFHDDQSPRLGTGLTSDDLGRGSTALAEVTRHKASDVRTKDCGPRVIAGSVLHPRLRSCPRSCLRIVAIHQRRGARSCRWAALTSRKPAMPRRGSPIRISRTARISASTVWFVTHARGPFRRRGSACRSQLRLRFAEIPHSVSISTNVSGATSPKVNGPAKA